MDQLRCKRGPGDGCASSHVEDEKVTKKKKSNVDNGTIGLEFHLLELPMHLIYDILSRVPMKTILHCKCVCKTFFKILTNPYFSKLHLSNAPNTTPILIGQDNHGGSGFVSMCMLNLDDTCPSTSSSINACTSTLGRGHSGNHAQARGHYHSMTRRSVKFGSLSSGKATPIGSCNGLLLLYHTSSQESLYVICNPILGEYTILPNPTHSKPAYTYLNHSDFGYCPENEQYKVIRFMCKISFDHSMTSTSERVAEIHTLGTQSWRSISNAPIPKRDASFDPYLNGTLHWITDSRKVSDLICSFDLHTEQFRVVPPPFRSEADYINKISGMKIGSLRGCLCVTYVFEDVQFVVWVMKDYGAKESWTKQFSIDIYSYCGLRGEDFYHPINFLHNGDLLFMSKFSSLVSYSPGKRTFKDRKPLEAQWTGKVIAHIPSFLSLKHIMFGQNLEVKKSDGSALH